MSTSGQPNTGSRTIVPAVIGRPYVGVTIPTGPPGPTGPQGPPGRAAALWLGAGAANNRVSSPSTAGLSAIMNQGFDVRMKLALAPGAPGQYPVNFGSASFPQIGASVGVGGVMATLQNAETNSAFSGPAMTLAELGNPVPNVDFVTVRLTFDPTTSPFTFVNYRSLDEGETWQQVNAGTRPSAPLSSFPGPLSLGPFGGSVAWFDVRQLDGTPLCSCDLTNAWNSRWRDPQGNVWTIDGTEWAWRSVVGNPSNPHDPAAGPQLPVQVPQLMGPTPDRENP